MGKEMRVTCDSCAVDVYGKKYYTLCIRNVNKGKQGMNPTIYLCPKCFRETKLQMLLFGAESEGE